GGAGGINPAGRQAVAAAARDVGGEAVADEKHFGARWVAQPLEGGVEDRYVRLNGAHLLRDDHLCETVADHRARQSRALDVAEPVGDESEAVLRAKGGDHLSCAFDQVAGAGEVAEGDGAERRWRQRLAQGLEEQLEPAQGGPLSPDLAVPDPSPDPRVAAPVGV